MTTFITKKIKHVSIFILFISLVTGCKVVDEIKKDLYVKIVTSSDLNGVLWTSAVLFGEVTDDGGKAITEKGIVYGKNPLPTVNDFKVPVNPQSNFNGVVFNLTGVGKIGVEISNLTVNTRYYYRAYCINSLGVSYGEEQSFNTKQYEDPKVTTTSITATLNSINVSGNLTNLYIVGPVVGSGFYYSETPGVKDTNYFVLSSSSIDSKFNFSATISQLPDRTVYYVKAFVRTQKGVYLGNELMVKTLDSPTRTQLKQGLQVFFSFSSNPNDESGNGFNGTASGVTLTKDRFNNSNSAYSFNGVPGTKIQTNYPGVLGNNSRSISLWVRRPLQAFNGSYLLTWGTQASGTSFGLFMAGRDKTQFFGVDNGGSSIQSIFNSLSDGNWHHYVVVYDNSIGKSILNVKTYIDGVYYPIAENWNPQNINTVQGINMVIGEYSSAQSDWRTTNGEIDDVGVWNRVLSSSEIQYLFQNNYKP
jgi:hypothetical protein